VYGWGAMVEELSRQGFIEVGEEEASSTNVRCLSLAEQVLGKRSGDKAIWFDFGRRALLQHQSPDSYIRRRPLNKESTSPNHERMVIALLLGDVRSDANSDDIHLPDLQLVDESWVWQGDRVRLDITFGSGSPPVGPWDGGRLEERWHASIWLEPETH
jgi:hypothetical protein